MRQWTRSAHLRRAEQVPGKGTVLWWAAAPGALLFAYLQIRGYWEAGTLGLDSHAYWLAAQSQSQTYSQPIGQTDAYLYSPAFVQVLKPLALLPWPAFAAVWAAAGLSVLCWLLGPLGVVRGAIVGMFLVSDLLVGNIYTFFAAALVLSLRGYAGALSLPILTKVIPGMVGLWHLVRGEWRAVGWACGATLAIVLVSYVVDREGWAAWFELLRRSGSGESEAWSPAFLLIPLAIVLVAAWSGNPWLLAPAMVLCRPLSPQFAVLAILAAIPRLQIAGKSMTGIALPAFMQRGTHDEESSKASGTPSRLRSSVSRSSTKR